MWKRGFSSSARARRALTEKKWDALVVGGGHNGLTAAAYLARGGLSVAVLERRHLIGGAAVTEEVIPGFKFSRCSYLLSLLRPSIVRELDLVRHGLKLLKPIASSFTPCLDGRYLLLGLNDEHDYLELSKFSKMDADAYPRYENQLHKFCEFMDFILDSRTPENLHGGSSFNNQLRDKWQKSVFWASCLRHALSLGQKDMVEFVDILLSPTSKVLNKWFEFITVALLVIVKETKILVTDRGNMQSDVLKATLAADAIIGSMVSIHTSGSGYVLLHHVMGETDGHRNIWSHVEGGMGSVSLAISNAAKEAGVHIVTDAEVSQLMIEDSGIVNGVLLADGTQVYSLVVLSNATPYKTFMEFIPHGILPDDFLCAIKNSDYSSGTTKINVAVDRLPQFQCCRLSHPEVGPQHTATIRIGCESMENIDSACQDAWNGVPSRRPVMEMTIPSSLDETISPPGKHVVSLFTQYTPYKPSDGSWEDAAYRESYAHRCFDIIEEYAPGFRSSVIGYDMLTPPDLEREFGLTGGNIFHGAMGLDSLFLLRPVKGWSNYRTPVRGLYMCGSGSHPGGGVMGAPGRNAAFSVLLDVNRPFR
ncbi:NAD(P)-binding domain containing protein [Trema orientale]|uniref:NAD(P)-binding domain containing protein n=1 Tax=Trema orientale TaxID=63057 RepID=A0A2P5FXM1_TREOI|nr:NAD(P)-binding domain containing protein [Trema orientale]